MIKVAYWPGCVSRGFTPELHGSMAAVAPKLDIELIELDRANCCGAGVIAEHNQELVDTLNARTFAIAQGVEGALGMMNICSTCQGAQSECQERLDADTAYRQHINQHIKPEGLAYEKDAAGGTRTSCGCWWRTSGSTRCASAWCVRSTGLRVAPFYGCYIVRPRSRLGFEQSPTATATCEMVIEAIGARRWTTPASTSAAASR